MSHPNSNTEYKQCYICEDGELGSFCSKECEDYYWLIIYNLAGK